MTAVNPAELQPSRRSLQIPPGDHAAYLFDCDGTIADSMPLHHQAWRRALEGWGCEFPEPLFYAWAGRPIPAIVESLNEQQGLAMPVQEVARRREEAYFELLPGIRAVPSVLEQIELQHGRIPLAVVSGSPRASVIRTLSFLRLLERFETLVCAEDYRRGKPAPDAFLLAAERLGVDPARCLVFEDSDLGIEAARAAGMNWVKVP